MARSKKLPIPMHPLHKALNAEESKRGRFLTTAEVMKVYTKTLPKIREDMKGIRGSRHGKPIKVRKAKPKTETVNAGAVDGAK